MLAAQEGCDLIVRLLLEGNANAEACDNVRQSLNVLL